MHLRYFSVLNRSISVMGRCMLSLFLLSQVVGACTSEPKSPSPPQIRRQEDKPQDPPETQKEKIERLKAECCSGGAQRREKCITSIKNAQRNGGSDKDAVSTGAIVWAKDVCKAIADLVGVLKQMNLKKEEINNFAEETFIKEGDALVEDIASGTTLTAEEAKQTLGTACEKEATQYEVLKSLA